jgi:predicted anti-sigma-YlaC factor YlaD
MNHQLYEDLMTDTRPLSAAESLSLADHLRECPQCQSTSNAVTEVETLFHRAESIEPRAGFTNRFGSRLALRRARAARRQHFATLFAASAALLVVTFFFGFELVNFGISASATTLKAVLKLMDVAGYLSLAARFIWVLVENSIGRIPVVFWLLVSYVMSGLCVIWLASLYKFSFQRTFERSN